MGADAAVHIIIFPESKNAKCHRTNVQRIIVRKGDETKKKGEHEMRPAQQ